MTCIVTDWEGVRYRSHGDPVDEKFTDPLPRVPSWVLPGQAPQFLSDDPQVEIREGDIMLVHAQNHEWFIVKVEEYGTPAPMSEMLGIYIGVEDRVFPGEPIGTWLISRADPEEDI